MAGRYNSIYIYLLISKITILSSFKNHLFLKTSQSLVSKSSMSRWWRERSIQYLCTKPICHLPSSVHICFALHFYSKASNLGKGIMYIFLMDIFKILLWYDIFFPLPFVISLSSPNNRYAFSFLLSLRVYCVNDY